MIIIKKIIKFFINIPHYLLFKLKFNFWPPPYWSDLSKYEILLEEINSQKILSLDGDFVEIGCFLGGGTYKLCKYLQVKKSNKKVYALDIFLPNYDKTKSLNGKMMCSIYRNKLKGKNQLKLFKQVTKDCNNLVTIMGDSKKTTLPLKKISFGYIDGNHSSEYVRNDFKLIWNKLVKGGVISFDDYGYDLPNVTKEINSLISINSNKINKIWTRGPKTIFIQKN